MCFTKRAETALSAGSSLVSNGTIGFFRFSLSIQRVEVCCHIHIHSNIVTYWCHSRQICSFSKAFYAYLTAICQGAQGNYTNLASFKQEIVQLTRSSSRKVRKDFDKFLSESHRALFPFVGYANNKISSSSNQSVSQRRSGPPKFFLLEIFGVWSAVYVECFRKR